MVRFKNRHLLVEFLDPSSITAFPSSSSLPIPDAIDNESDYDGEEELAQIPDLPFVLPLDGGQQLIGDEGAFKIYKAVRSVVQDVFGDEGWGRIASSFKVVYHSTLTTLTIMRVARPHYRLLWAAVTMLRSVGDVPVLPRVVAVSGTIKKLQSAAIVHHRRVTASAVAALLAQGTKGEAEKERLTGKWETECEELARLED